MNRRYWLVVSLFGLLGCAPVSTPLYIEAFWPIKDPTTCEVSLDKVLPYGELDVGGGDLQFTVGVSVKGAKGFSQQAVTVGGKTLEAEDRSRPVLTKMTLRYAFSPTTYSTLQAVSEDKPKSQHVYSVPFSLPMNEDRASGAIDLIVPKVAQAISEELTSVTTGEDKVTMTVAVEFEGYMTGTGNTIKTGALEFPVTLLRSACAKPTKPNFASCLHPGQSPASACCDGKVPAPPGCE